MKTSLQIESEIIQMEFETGIWGPKMRDWRDVVEDYLSVSKKRFNNKLAQFKLQTQLIQEIYDIQGHITSFKKIIKEPNKIKYLSNVDKLEKYQIDNLKFQLGQEIRILSALKEICDGHLWRIFKYNRQLLGFMGNQPSTGNIKFDKGFLSEVQNWGNAIKDHNVSHFILNDLTNFARIGDVIVKYLDGKIEVREVKSTASQRGTQRRQRLEKQAEKRKCFVELANSGETVFNKQTKKILKIKYPYKTHLSLLKQCLKESEFNGICGRSISPYLKVICVDYETANKYKLNDREVHTYLEEFRKPIKNNDIIFPLFSNERVKFSPYFTPFSIYPFDDTIIADLLAIKKQIYYFFNISEFCRLIEKKNWHVKLQKPQSEYFCLLGKGNRVYTLPWSILNQIVFDMISFKCLMEIYEYLVKNNLSQDEGYLVGFDTEEKYWN